MEPDIVLDEQVELCRQGDRKAFFVVYNQYAKGMLNSSMRLLNNLADAEDIVQESFTDAFNSLEKFSYKSSFEGWLRRIVINKSISLLRKRKIHWCEPEVENLASQEEVFFDEEVFAFNIERIKTAIKELPENYRVVFNLFVIEELKQEEIASLLNISHNNVRTIYHRARKKLINSINLVS
ncbi:MAG: RNA polymerase sigma factor [Niabella sp.]